MTWIWNFCDRDKFLEKYKLTKFTLEQTKSNSSVTVKEIESIIKIFDHRKLRYRWFHLWIPLAI